MGTPLYIKADVTGVIAQNVAFIPSDVTTGNIAGRGMDLIVELKITSGTTPIIEVSYDGQVTWTVLIAALALNTITRVRTISQGPAAVNFRTPTIGGLTLARFLVVGDPDA